MATAEPAPGSVSGGAGRLVVVCGIDGSGKTTQLRRLAASLRAGGFRVHALRLLSVRSPIFQVVLPHLDRLPRQSYCDMIAVERFRLARRRLPALLDTHDLVLSDRYLYADYAYTRAYGCETAFIERLIASAPRPDLSVLLDLPAERALERIRDRGRAWPVQENLRVLRGARRAYLDYWTAHGLPVVCANQPVEAVSAGLSEHVSGVGGRV